MQPGALARALAPAFVARAAAVRAPAPEAACAPQGLPKVGLGWGGNRTEVERQVVQLVKEGIWAAKDRQGTFEKTQQRTANTAAAATAAAAVVPAVVPGQHPSAAFAPPPAVKKGMV